MLYENHHNSTDSLARAGVLHLPHGDVLTPMFMPVGTNATVKAILHRDIVDMGYRLILANTYHLYLRLNKDILKKYGGLHQFSNWNGNILTDSGGFQIFSLAAFRKIKEEGVKFRSHIDGSYHLFTPENVVEFQQFLNSDIQMALDVCSPYGIDEKKAYSALVTTTKWAKRAKIQYQKAIDEGYGGALFGIIQGNFYKELRKKSALELLELDFPGYAIGGLSVGEPSNLFSEFLSYSAQFLPSNKPRYLMGIGTPEYILEAVENGIDIFDCVFPTRIARNGALFTSSGIISIKKAIFAGDENPIEEGCDCLTCKGYSRGYLHHVAKSNEIIASTLSTIHNLAFMKHFIDEIRVAILNNDFLAFKTKFLDRYSAKR